MKTKTVGEILREEREHYKLSLPELSKRTRIRLQYLQALESNQFDKLPAATFVKGYIKTYARIFAFDELPLLALLRRDYKESVKGKLVPREFIKPVLKKRQVWTPVTVIVMMLSGIFLTLMIYLAVQWYNLNKPPLLEFYRPKDEAFVAAKVLVEGKTEEDATILVNSQPVALQPDGTFSTEIFLTREGLTTITVEAIDRKGKTTLKQRTVRVKF